MQQMKNINFTNIYDYEKESLKYENNYEMKLLGIKI